MLQSVQTLSSRYKLLALFKETVHKITRPVSSHYSFEPYSLQAGGPSRCFGPVVDVRTRHCHGICVSS
jgi:hypothetical protein